MGAKTIDFWFTMGSTYTALSVARIDNVAKTAGILVRWRPFRNVAALTGVKQLPFIEGTAKLRYMWRDIERRATKYGLPVRLPAPYPVPSSAQANRVALLGMQEGWGSAYVRAAYRNWFEQGLGNGGEDNLRASLTEVGQSQDIGRILSMANSTSLDRELDLATDEARKLGVFGSPTFAVETELFWGDDHLEDAILWACQGSLAADPPTVLQKS